MSGLPPPPAKQQGSFEVQSSTDSAILNAVTNNLSFYLHDGGRTYFAAICLNLVLAVILMTQWTEVQVQALYIAPFPFFSALYIWNTPTDRKNLLHPQLYMAVQTLLASLIVFQSPLIAIFFFSPLCMQAMLKFRSQKIGVLWTCLLALLTLADFWYHRESLGVPFSFNAIATCAGFLFFAMLGSMLARLRRNRAEIKHLLTRLADTQMQLQAYAAQAAEMGAASERERLAGELHDSLGHRLTIAAVQLEGTLRLMERARQRDQVAKKIESAHGQLIQGLDELRGAIKSMHSLALNSDNLVHALQSLVAEVASASDIVHHSHLPDTLPRLSVDQCMTIYRTVQEALTNVQKHGRARTIWLEIEIIEDDTLLVKIRNDGQDFDATDNGNGYGIRGMRERAAQLGGTVRVTRPAAGGTLVTLRLPLGAAKVVAAADGESVAREVPA